MTSEEVRQKFLDFYEERGHAVIPSASLIPQDDPTTLLTGSGMQPLIPYLFGKEHPKGKRIADSQKCFRAEDIEEVGDNRHTTFFEMLGNWSFGDYFKKEQLAWFFEFLTDVVGLEAERLYVTVFSGDDKNGIPRDDESVEIWKKLFEDKGIKAETRELLSNKEGGEQGMQDGRIFYYDSSKNWWSRKGLPEDMPSGELGGPDSEVFYKFVGVKHNPSFGKHCHPNCECGRFLEIGNSVFMEYKKGEDGKFENLEQRNVDFGGGLERIVAASEDNPDIFAIDSFSDIIDALGERYGWDYATADGDMKRRMRIVADHVRAAVFISADGVVPSNKEEGYILRRLLRRAIFNGYKFAKGFSNLYPLVNVVVDKYGVIYRELESKRDIIHDIFEKEETLFMRTLEKGDKELKKMIREKEKFTKYTVRDRPDFGSRSNDYINAISGKDAFYLYQTYGFPFELIKEELARHWMFPHEGEFREELEKEFKKEFKKHQAASVAGVEKKFGGHGLILNTGELKAADTEELSKVTRLHTATHLLQAALRGILGDEVLQRGSDITVDRTRFDFSFPRKVTKEELQRVEDKVNEIIKADLPFQKVELPLEKAKKSGALYVEVAKYPDVVKVYYSGVSEDDAFSKEICGGPHVEHTGEIGKFVILKEKAVSAGVRRIRADVE